jgi:hypothetical protein
MPRLLIHRKKTKSSNKTGSRVTFVLPHSPFQKIIEAGRVEHRLSYAQLAKQISEGKKSVHPGSLWIWLHTPNGYPHPKSCTASHLRRLSAVLRIPLPRLQEALDSSRHLFTQRERATATLSIDSWKEFVNWLENDKREMLRKTTVLNMARQFHAAAGSAAKKKGGVSGRAPRTSRQYLAPVHILKGAALSVIQAG